jgi:hypothetical protein
VVKKFHCKMNIVFHAIYFFIVKHVKTRIAILKINY